MWSRHHSLFSRGLSIFWWPFQQKTCLLCFTVLVRQRNPLSQDTQLLFFLAVACCQKPVSFGSKRRRKNERKRTFWIAFLNWTVEWSLFKIKRAGNSRLRPSNCRCFGWETFLFFTVPVEWKEGLVNQESKDYFLLPLPMKFIYEILGHFRIANVWQFNFRNRKLVWDLVSKWSD